MKTNNSDQRRVFKLGLGLLVVLVLCSSLFLKLMPKFIATESRNDAILNKSIEDITKDDISEVMAKMRRVETYTFYFSTIDKLQIDMLSYEVLEILKRGKTNEGLLEQLELMKRKVSSAGLLFYNLEFPDDFYKNPNRHSTLKKVMWQFIYEEFKLTLLGICYKSLFDPEFTFQWGEAETLSAQKLKNVMNQSQRRQFQKSVTP